ncbi:shikimate dehydrogenase family protein [Sediminicola arcticus]|jgi:shikimate dehydrogenase|uniref:Shikimate dehydrogenase n=1 Tax=Sediminicola arcticus TaxID=1574308 RepID=A0ABV2SST5_9FLAO
MEDTEVIKNRFGLVGKNISYSFSKGYFTQKFSSLNLVNNSYENFDLQHITEFEDLIKSQNDLKGLNVTIPYKEAIIPYLDKVDHKAAKIGAVNTIKFTEEGLIGFNTDVFGFQDSIEPHLKKHHKKALILGTGGASKAVAFVFKELGIAYTFISRNQGSNQLSYEELNQSIVAEHTILVNCTPLGTSPNIMDKPSLPYEFLTDRHLLFDLIYNPEKTAFLKEGEAHGALILNGHKMLAIQAEKAWEIWNSE